MTRRSDRGWTLIELMVSVAIVAALASIAIPSLVRFSLRAKVAERTTVMLRIRQEIQDYYVRNGTAVPPSSGGLVVSGFNPPLPPSSVKRVMLTNLPGWNMYFTGNSLQADLEGSVYYSYDFEVTDTGQASTIRIYAAGDLDGDGIVSWRYTFWDRSGGAYNPSVDFPPPGLEDEGTYGSF
jgi:type IV pilus assembly protein PilE